MDQVGQPAVQRDDVRAWLAAFEHALAARDIAAVLDLFHDECYWRDLVAFTWNVKTLEGKDGIGAMLEAVLDHVAPENWALSEAPASGGEEGPEAFFTFETRLGRGVGHVRLKDGRAWTLLTSLSELKGHEERKGRRRINGVAHGAHPGRRQTWLDERWREGRELGFATQPYVVIVGGGQGGIGLGARLRRLGVPAIILEKNARAGDSWRNRYRSLVLHDPVWYDHLPYLAFPDDWPVFTPRDKIGDWLEAYVSIMELNYWTSSTLVSAGYDDAAEEWSVTVNRNGEEITLRPKHLVSATGAYGPPKLPELPGMEHFKGTQLHSSAFGDGGDWQGRKCVVVGSGSSAHDICADLFENGADVTMVQRSSSTVVRSETLLEFGFKGLYSEDALERGITTDIADLTTASMPFRVAPRYHIPLWQRITDHDAKFYAQLAAAGFRNDFGEDGSGLMLKGLRRGSGFYIDVGCSALIIDRRIGLKSGAAITRLTETGLAFDDGSELNADLIVYATGFHTMQHWVATHISPEVAERVGHCWGYGSGTTGDPGPWEGELRNFYKPTRQKALWFHGGNLFMSRFYSQHVALQLKARMEGIPTPVLGQD